MADNTDDKSPQTSPETMESVSQNGSIDIFNDTDIDRDLDTNDQMDHKTSDQNHGISEDSPLVKSPHLKHNISSVEEHSPVPNTPLSEEQKCPCDNDDSPSEDDSKMRTSEGSSGLQANETSDEDVTESQTCLPNGCKHRNDDTVVNMIQCCLCTIWHHIDCVGMTAKQFKKQGFWPCPSCRLMPKRVADLQKSIQNMVKLLTSVSEQVCCNQIPQQNVTEDLSAQTHSLELLAAKIDECEKLKTSNENLRHKLNVMERSLTSDPSDSECSDVDESDNTIDAAKGHLLIGDSLIQNVEPTDDELVVACMRGAKLNDVSKKLRSIDRSYNRITIVCGTNDLTTKSNIEKITENAQSLLQIAKTKAKSVTISSIPPRLDKVAVDRVNSMNERLAAVVQSYEVTYINNDQNFKFLSDIPDESLLLADGLHLSDSGVNRLLRNLGMEKLAKCNLGNSQSPLISSNDKSKEQSKKREKKRICTKSGNGITLFYGKDSIFSNLHMETPIHVDGQRYNCNEQLYTQKMANYFGDKAAADEAMEITDPYKLIDLQKRVKNYNRQEWLPEAEKTLYLANMAKYTQNTLARDALIRTGSNTIGEATYSKTWGIGASLHDARSLKGEWSGRNVMGKLLMNIRDTINGKTADQHELTSHRHAQYEKSCWFCGERNHMSKNCKHGRKLQCNYCFKLGHKSKFCDF